MSSHSEHREFLERELAKVGVKPEILRNGGDHMEMRWRSNEGRLRSILTSWTPSDHRSVLNARARMRKILRDDGMLEIKPRKEKVPKLAKALAMPVIPDTDRTRIERLENDVNTLLDMLKDLTAKLVAHGIKLEDEPVQAPPPAQPITPPVVKTVEPKQPKQPKERKNAWRHYFLLCLEYQPVHLSVIAKRAECTYGCASVRLDVLKKEKMVENTGSGMWRKTKKAANGVMVNGHRIEHHA
jgi:hypothetical protein